MSIVTMWKPLTASAVLGLVASVAAAQQPPRPAQPAQQQQRPAGQAAAPASGSSVVQLKGDPNQQKWTKVCGKDPATNRETCYTTRDFVAENDQPVMAVAVYETTLEGNRKERQVRYLLPLTFLLPPGVRTAIDSAAPVPGRYTICLPNGCFAEFNVNDQVFANLKKAQKITIQVQNQAGREVSFSLPMDGFAAGFDGTPIDPAALEAEQRKMQEELQRRSDEMRRQMQGGAAAPAPGAAPAAPAAPAPGAAPAPAAPAAPGAAPAAPGAAQPARP
jgi:invasion protein IalB